MSNLGKNIQVWKGIFKKHNDCLEKALFKINLQMLFKTLKSFEFSFGSKFKPVTFPTQPWVNQINDNRVDHKICRGTCMNCWQSRNSNAIFFFKSVNKYFAIFAYYKLDHDFWQILTSNLVFLEITGWSNSKIVFYYVFYKIMLQIHYQSLAIT